MHTAHSDKAVLQGKSSESSRVLTLERFQQIQSSARTYMTAFKARMTAERRYEEVVAFTVGINLPEAASEFWDPGYGHAVHDFITTCTVIYGAIILDIHCSCLCQAVAHAYHLAVRSISAEEAAVVHCQTSNIQVTPSPVEKHVLLAGPRANTDGLGRA